MSSTPSIEVRLPFVQEGESCFKYADMRCHNLKTINAFFSTQILYDDKLKNLSKKRLNQLGRFSFFGHFVLTIIKGNSNLPNHKTDDTYINYLLPVHL